MFYKRKLFFRIARIIGMFFLGLVVAVLIALSQVNLETLRDDLLHVMRDATDLHIEIDGDISWKFSLRPKVEMNNVRVPNKEWAKNKDGFVAKKIDVTLNLVSLLRDRPTIQNVKIHDSVMFLEHNGDDESSLRPSAEHEKDEKKPVAESGGNYEKYPFDDPALGSIEVRNFTAHINDSVYRLAGFTVGYNSGKDSKEYAGWIKLETKVYPFIVSFTEFNTERKIYPVRVALSTGGEALVANIALEGTSKMPIDFILKGNIPDIAGLGRAFGVDIPDMPMVRINLAGGFDYNKLNLRKSTISVRGNDMNISGTLDWSAKVPAITAKIQSKKINLADVFPSMYSPGAKWVRPKRDLNVFKNTPLFGSELFNYNIKLDADIDEILFYRELAARDIDLGVNLRGGALRVDLDAKMADGDIRVAVDVQADSDGGLDVRAAGLGERVYFGDILNMVREPDFISELPMNFQFYLQGHGSNLSEIMSTVTGPIYINSVAPGYAHSELVSYVYGTDFLTSLRHGIQDLFRSKKKHDQIKISCVVINLKARNGIIETEHGVAVETNAINIRLAGKADFGKEKLKLSLMTVPVRGLKISLTGNVVNAIEITGNLAEPDIKISGTAVAGKVASATGIGLLLAPFTGGIGLVAGAGVGWLAGDLIENWLSDDRPCRTSLKTGAPAKRDDPEWLNKPMAELVSGMIDRRGGQ